MQSKLFKSDHLALHLSKLLRSGRALGFAAILPVLGWAQSGESPGVTASEIRIGQFAVTSGPAAELGLRVQAGMHAYFKAVNAQGGVLGRSIKLVTRDDGYEPERAAAAVRALTNEDKVFALAGSVGTPTGLAALPILTEERVPLVGMVTGAESLRTPHHRNVFHVRASYFDETERIIQHLSILGLKRVAVLYQNDAYGKAGLEGVNRAMAKRDSKPVALGLVERNSTNVAQALEEILKVHPEAIVQITAYKSSAEFIRQAKALGYGGQFFNVSFVGSKALADALGDTGKGVVISQVVPFPYTGNSAVVRDYRQRMQEAGDNEIDFSSFEGYLCARVLVEGLKRAGSHPTRESLISGLESMHQVDFGGFTVSYSSTNHQGSNFTDLTIIGQGGKFIH